MSTTPSNLKPIPPTTGTASAPDVKGDIAAVKGDLHAMAASARAAVHTLSVEGKEEFKKFITDFERLRGESLQAVKELLGLK